MSDDGPPRKKRAYAFACTTCSRKKVKCDGTRPRCAPCEHTDSQCVYQVHPARQLKEPGRALEARVERIEALLGISGTSGTAAGPPRDADQARAAVEELGAGAGEQSAQPSGDVSREGSAILRSDKTRYSLSIGETGQLVYHGLTSLAHGDGDDLVNEASEQVETQKEPFLIDSSFIPIYQALSATSHISVDPEMGTALLNTFFAYSSPLYNVVHQGIFLRDMALGGKYFSNFLLMSLYSSGTRMVDGLQEGERRERGDLFARLARGLLTTELEGPSKITTIQGLLVLSGRECAVGDSTQGWLHAGMAFRMMGDLGMHLCWEKSTGASKFSPEERELRDRLYWSCLTWDVTISLSLGREPSFPLRPGQSPDRIPLGGNDAEEWRPFYAYAENTPVELVDYRQSAHCILTFRWNSRLNILLHDVINQLYGAAWSIVPPDPSFVGRTKGDLQAWFQALPAEIKLQDPLPSQCPPPNIFCVNLLYHATWILLSRPTATSPGVARTARREAADNCRKHVVEAHKLVELFGRTFGSFKMSYSAMYSCFVAAGFDVSSLSQCNEPTRIQALTRIASWLSILGKSAIQGPSIRSSITSLRRAVKEQLAQFPALANSELVLSILGPDPVSVAATGIHGTSTTTPSVHDDPFGVFIGGGDMVWELPDLGSTTDAFRDGTLFDGY